MTIAAINETSALPLPTPRSSGERTAKASPRWTPRSTRAGPRRAPAMFRWSCSGRGPLAASPLDET
jgi:hypothetical protein